MPTFSTAFRDYESLLKRLHDLDRLGLLDSEEADAIREEMDQPWLLLSAEEQTFLESLSADLHTLSDDPPDLRVSTEDEQEALRELPSAFHARRWAEVLRLLRRVDRAMPKPLVAYVRGRCWGALEDWLAAYWFLERACALDPDNDSYRFLALDARFKSGSRDEALREAHALLDGDGQPPRIVFGAAKVVFNCAREMPEAWSRQLYSAIIKPLRNAIEREHRLPRAQRLDSATIEALHHLALALELMDRADDARGVHDEAVARFPGHDTPQGARALFFLQQGAQAEALRDFEALIQRETRFAYAYQFAAHRALVDRDYSRCAALCDAGMQRADSSALRANLLEWSAISMCELGAPAALVRPLFEEAVTLDPLNERIRRNRGVFERAAGSHDPAGHDFEIQTPPRQDQAVG